LTVRLVTGWKLDDGQRALLLEQFPPRFERVIADHVTLRTGTNADTPLPRETHGEIVGETDDGAGVQALIVRIGGTTDRDDGSSFHITWSLGAGRQARESNDVIARQGWRSIAPFIAIALRPAQF
jgi:hypothetical protein